MNELDPLVGPLAKIVVEVAWLLEESVEGEFRGAVRTLDWMAGVFDSLPADERHRLAEVVSGLSVDEKRREFVDSFAEAFRLAD